ncbi:hypothetical protein H0O03_02635 [Candidatus Micrarchaeota archaeon]|nr:hypothetical protein [Candidatus Micrarchaeota archaeon]
MTGVSKAGLASLAIGLVVMFLVWYLAFFKGDAVASLLSLALTAVLGGVFLFGLFLFVIGVLILVL